MLVYDITNEKSFDNIKNWIRNIEEVITVHLQYPHACWGAFWVHHETYYLQHASSDVERMILGNKCDVNDKRQVSKDRGEKVMRGTVNNQNQERLHFKKYSSFSLLSFAVSWHLIMESSSWRLVQRQTSMWRMWVCVMLFCLHAPTFGTLTL